MSKSTTQENLIAAALQILLADQAAAETAAARQELSDAEAILARIRATR